MKHQDPTLKNSESREATLKIKKLKITQKNSTQSSSNETEFKPKKNNLGNMNMNILTTTRVTRGASSRMNKNKPIFPSLLDETIKVEPKKETEELLNKTH